MRTLIFRLPDDIADALEKDADNKTTSTNTLVVQYFAEKYGLDFDSTGIRTTGFFKNGELNNLILELVKDRKLTSREIANEIIKTKELTFHEDLRGVRKSISSILSGMGVRGLIKKAGQRGRNNMWISNSFKVN